MTLTAFWLIICSAILHASWNLLAKKSHSSLPFYTLICTVGPLVWLHMQFWSPVKISTLPLSFWIALACSVLSDVTYAIGLFKAYDVMDISTAYPIMRSLPIIFTLIVTSVFGIGAPIGPLACIGMFVVFCGCMIMPLANFSDFKASNYFNKNMLFIIIVACGTTGYTVFDKIAQNIVRDHFENISAAVRSMTFYSTRGLCLSSTLWLISLSRSKYRAMMLDFFRKKDFKPLLAGVFASGTYVLVLISMNYVSNVSYVQVFRQVGLLVAMLLGFVVLKERCTATKCTGVTLILIGLALCVI